MTRMIGTFAAARLCHVWPSTIRNWHRDGLIPEAHVEFTLGGHLRIDEEFLVNLKAKRANAQYGVTETEETA